MTISDSIWDASNTTLALTKTAMGGDEMENEEPVHDADTNVDADNWNVIVAAVAECAKRLRPGNIVAVNFEVTVVQSATTAVPLQGSTVTEWLAFKDATLVGLAAKFGSALTAGQCTFAPEIGGVDTALQLVIAATDQSGRAYQLVEAAAATDAIDASALEALEIDAIGDATFACAASELAVVTAFLNIGEEEEL